MFFIKSSPRPPPALISSIEKKKTGIIVFKLLKFSKAFIIPTVFEKAISTPLVSLNPGASQNKNRSPSNSNSIVEQNEVSDFAIGLFLNFLRRWSLKFFTPICFNPLISVYSKSSYPRYYITVDFPSPVFPSIITTLFGELSF
jgi:hypothetical protein